MTRAEFQKLLRKWCQEDDSDFLGFRELKNFIEFLESVLFHEYAPTAHGDHGEFGARLARWIGSADSDANRQTLYLMLRNLIFIGQNEISASYRTAYSKIFLSWLIEQTDICVFDEGAADQLRQAQSSALFTQITDSFGLQFFLRANHLHGQNDRYTWEQDLPNWDRENFQQTRIVRQNRPDIQFIVLFEDFVGSGTQMAEAVCNACSLGNGFKILLCPLIICPEGAQLAEDLERRYENLCYRPVLGVASKFFIGENPIPDENREFAEIRQCLLDIHPKVMGGAQAQQNFGPFGYRDTGAFIVKYDNCPDNSVPAIHRRNGEDWHPLFFRTSREMI